MKLTYKMNRSNLINYSLKLTEKIKENIIPHIDKLILVRKLLNNKIKLNDVYSFGFVDRNELIGIAMNINMEVFLSNANIIHPKNPTYVYYRICQKCHNVADVPSPNDQSVKRYICDFCGACLVIDNPIQVLGQDEGIEELMNIQRINVGGELFD